MNLFGYSCVNEANIFGWISQKLAKKHPELHPEFGHIFGLVKRKHPEFHQNPVGALLVRKEQKGSVCDESTGMA